MYISRWMIHAAVLLTAAVQQPVPPPQADFAGALNTRPHLPADLSDERAVATVRKALDGLGGQSAWSSVRLSTSETSGTGPNEASVWSDSWTAHRYSHHRLHVKDDNHVATARPPNAPPQPTFEREVDHLLTRFPAAALELSISEPSCHFSNVTTPIVSAVTVEQTCLVKPDSKATFTVFWIFAPDSGAPMAAMLTSPRQDPHLHIVQTIRFGAYQPFQGLLTPTQISVEVSGQPICSVAVSSVHFDFR